MRTKLYAGIGSGMVMSLLVIGGIFLMLLGAGAPAEAAPAAKTEFCHLQKKVDPDGGSPPFNNGKVVEVSKAACFAHCSHGDHPMSDPSCAAPLVTPGGTCIVNTPQALLFCNVDRCITLCEAL